MSAPQKRFALFGDPIAASPSPAMHNAGFEHLGLPYRYHLRPTPIQDLAGARQEIERGNWQGGNITIPLKEAFAEFLRCDAIATRAGAANTFVVENAKFLGTNTDIDGVRDPLLALENLPDGPMLVLGAGGAARAAILAAESMGRDIVVAARNVGKARATLESIAPQTKYRAIDLSEDALTGHVQSVAIWVQATPIGRDGQAHPIPWHLAQPQAIAFEMLYGAQPTAFLKDAQTQNLRTIEGKAMLLAQGVKAFEFWAGQAAPAAVMGRALDSHLAGF